MNEKIRPENGEHIPPELLEERKEWTLDRKVLAASLLVFVLSFSGCAASSYIEIINLRRPEIAEAVAKKKPKKQPLPKPPIHPLDFLPSDLDEYDVRGRQKMPGAGSYAAEAIFSPNTDDAQIKLPRNVYVSITYHNTTGEARATIENWLKSYPQDRKRVLVGKTLAKTGYNDEGNSWFVGWVVDKYAVQIDCTFTEGMRSEHKEFLKETGMFIAGEVEEQIGRHLR